MQKSAFQSFIFLSMASALLILAACSGGDSSTADSSGGSIAFSMDFKNPPAVHGDLLQPEAGDVCLDYGIATIRATLQRADSTVVKTGSWNCSLHTGTLSGIAPATGLILKVEGIAAGTTLWQGQKDSIQVVANQKTDAGIITMEYLNLPLLANAGDIQTVGEGVTVTLNGLASTPLGGIASFQWAQIEGPEVTLNSSDQAQANFVSPDVGKNGEALFFELVVTDYAGNTSRDICYVNVTWGNKPPIADAGTDQTVDENTLVTLDASGSTDPDAPDDDINSYMWEQTGGPEVTLSSTSAVKPTFTTPDVGPAGAILTFELTVTDNGGLKGTDTCTVTVRWVNLPPTADAGIDQTINEGATVTLDGASSSDPDDGIKSYLWTQTAGPTVTLSDPALPNPTFQTPNVGPAGAVLSFLLTVTDNNNLQDTDTCSVNVLWVNIAPNADAGTDQTVNEGVTVTLDGSKSTDPDDGIKSYEWAQTAGPTVSLSNSSAVKPTFPTPDVGMSGAVLTFRLTVTDNHNLQDTDTCTVAVNWVNAPPNAYAGADQNVNEGATVTLDASGSTDPDNGIKSYAWVQTAGSPTVVLSNASAIKPTFSAPDVGPAGTTLTFRLTVTDNLNLQDTDICIVTVGFVNIPPTADAGPDQTKEEGVTVTLNGDNSDDPDDGIKSYLWTRIAGPAVTITSANQPVASFTAPDVGPSGAALTFRLRVTDNSDATAQDDCIVNVTWKNAPPVANAGGDQTVNEAVLVTLNASGSTDPDDGIETYAWVQTAGPTVAISGAGTINPTFTAPNVGLLGTSLTFRLTVTDKGGLQDTDTCIINVTDSNTPPVAVATCQPSTVLSGDEVTLNGALSYDIEDGEVTSFHWTQTATDATNPVTLNSPNAASTTFFAPAVTLSGAQLEFELTVEDSEGLQGTDTCGVFVIFSN